MNYLLLALATAVAFIALLLTADILRVMAGKSKFNSCAVDDENVIVYWEDDGK